LKIVRTFHPIGQGAFYTERHNVKGKEFNIVYDCGSATIKGKRLETKIKSTFPENYEIDILFISHFHADHINGIDTLKKHCKIKNVVLPLLDQNAKTLVKVSNYINYGQTNTEIIDNPSAYFGNETILISIDEANTEERNNEINLEETIDISTINAPTTISSGIVFVSGLKNHDWLFIPVNYKQTVRLAKFISELLLLDLTLDDIDTIDKIIIHKKDIIKAYRKVGGELNQNSMILFSGKSSVDFLDTFTHCQDFHFHHRFPSRFYRINSSCLYFGDIDLKQPNILNDINNKFGKLLPIVGTIQVPHHGSILSFDSSILTKMKMNCAVFSYGTTNSYGHPSDRVISDFLSHSVFPYLVTEKQYSMVTQWK